MIFPRFSLARRLFRLIMSLKRFRPVTRLRQLVCKGDTRILLQATVLAILAAWWLAQPDRGLSALRAKVELAGQDMSWLCWPVLLLAVVQFALAAHRLATGRPSSSDSRSTRSQRDSQPNEPPDPDPAGGVHS